MNTELWRAVCEIKLLCLRHVSGTLRLSNDTGLGRAFEQVSEIRTALPMMAGGIKHLAPSLHLLAARSRSIGVCPVTGILR